MKKWIAVLLMLCMLLPLGGCNNTTPAAAPQASGGETVPEGEKTEAQAKQEPEKVYVTKSETRLARKIEEGQTEYALSVFGPLWPGQEKVTEYSYDAFGAVAAETVRFVDEETRSFLEAADYAEEFDKSDEGYEILRNEAGELVTVTAPNGMTYNLMNGSSFSTMDTASFEDGHVVKIDRVWKENGEHTETVIQEYHPNGVLKRQETVSNIVAGMFSAYSFEEPLVSVREYNEDGCCTLLHEENVNEFSGKLFVEEYRWEYDDDNNPITMSYARGEASKAPLTDVAEIQTELEMQYDRDKRMISGKKTEKGAVTEYRYTYREDGQLERVVRESGDRTEETTLEYDDALRLIAERRSVNGNPGKDTTYTWTEGQNGRFECTAEGDTENGIFADGSGRMYPIRFDENGNPLRRTFYAILPSAVTLEPAFTDRITEYEYETIQIKEEVDPAEMTKRRENQNALAEYYPVLAESYCGVPVPTPNGTQRLERIVVQEGSGALDLVTEFQYNEDGTLAGSFSYFDTTGERIASGEARFDEQGRLIWDRVTEDTTLEYEYGEDPEHYSFREVRSGEIFREEKYDLQAALPANWIRQTYGQARPYATITRNEDGLPIRQEYKSANGEVSVTEYSYQAQTGVDGTLTELIQYEDSWDSPLLRFDDKGYLVYYEAPNYQRVIYEYSGI